MEFIHRGDHQALALLVAAGMVEYRTVHDAVLRADAVSCAPMLLKHDGADTLLVHATMNRAGGIMRAALAAGANPNAALHGYLTPLVAAVTQRYLAGTIALLRAGAIPSLVHTATPFWRRTWRYRNASWWACLVAYGVARVRGVNGR